jgi:hypothetical protein
MITVQPIHYTSDPDAWHRFAETYNRTLRVSGPGGRELWINGVQQDLYGYRLLG